MRFLSVGILLLLPCSVVLGQTIDVKSSKTSALPTYRPVLIGKDPSAIINRIDTQDLLKKGQHDAVVMFSCLVKKTGEPVESQVYKGTEGSELFEAELKTKLPQARFIPGIYNHLPVDAIFYGTAVFAVVDGKPRLRIYSNQEIEEVKKQSDFIGPQPYFGGSSKFSGLHYPMDETPVPVKANVVLRLKIDETGSLQNIDVVTVEPPLTAFADTAMRDFSGAKFIPAFRDGKPEASEVTLPIFYNP